MSNAGIGKPPSRPYQSKYHHEMAVADNPDYIEIGKRRLQADAGLFARVAAD